MNKTVKISLILFALASLFTVSLSAQTKVTFSTKDINNKNVTDAIFADADVTMINIWATFCGPCISEMPDLGILNRTYADKGLQVIGIVYDTINRKGKTDTKIVNSAKKIVSETNADYIHLIPDSNLLDGILKDLYCVPTTVFVDSNGNIIDEIYPGSGSLADWQEIVDKLIK